MESKKINQLATNVAPVSSDLTIIGDPITGVSKKITLSQIASLFAGSVDFYANYASFPATGLVNTIYCAKDTQKLYLWSGSAYVETFPSQAVLNTYQLLSAKGVANGYASLDAAGKVPIAQLPSSIMEYKGLWSAATNTPTLANGTGDTGDVYIASAAGTVNFGAGGITFAIGDYVIYSGTIWQRSSGAVGTVTSVGLSSATSGVTIGSSPITTSGTITLAIATATTSQNGLLSSTDWATFNGKESVLTFTSPLSRSTNTISIPAATTSVNGYLDSADFTTFNNKQNAITLTTTGTSGASTFVGATLNIPNYGSALTGYVPYTGATQDVDLGAFKLNAQSLHIKGTGGLGHLGLKHQSASATSSANESVIFADSLGDLGWQNANLYLSKFITSANNANRSYTFPNATCNIPDDSLVVHLAGTETITGAKTFSGGVTFTSSLTTTSNVTFSNSGFTLVLQPPTLSVNRTVTLPDATGTLALTSDISYPVTSVFGRTGAVVATSGDYTTAQVTEVTNLYFTDARARAALSFAAGSGAYNSTTGVITIPTNNNQITNGAAYITLTSLSAGTGISYNNTTGIITNSAPDQTVSLTAGAGISVTGTYPSFTIASTITQYTDALARAAISLTTTGTTGAATYNNTTGVLNIPQYTDQFVGTVTSVAALTIGTTGTDLSSSVANSTTTPVITLNVPTASATNRGALSSADWTTFNNKQNALTNPVTGTGTTNYLPKFTGTSTIGNSIISESVGAINIAGNVTLTNSTTPLLYLNTTSTNQASAIFTSESGTNKWAFGSSLGTGDGAWSVYNFGASARYLSIASTGAATFSSSVAVGGSTAQLFLNGSGGYGWIQYQNNGAGDWIHGTNVGGAGQDWNLYNYGTSSSAFKIAKSNNAATFSSSLQGNGGVYSGTGASAATIGGKAATASGLTDKDLTLSAWYPTSGTNEYGGDLYLAAGRPTGGGSGKYGTVYIQAGIGNGTSNVAGSVGTVISASNTLLQFFTATTEIASPTERMRITSGGRVGIGTSSPGYPLTVDNLFTDAGTLSSGGNLNGTAYFGYGGLVVGTQSTTGHTALFTNSAGRDILFGGWNGSTNTERMRITSGGNVEINTGSIKTGTPSGGTAKPWKLGQDTNTLYSATRTIQVEVDGGTYYLLAVKSTDL